MLLLAATSHNECYVNAPKSCSPLMFNIYQSDLNQIAICKFMSTRPRPEKARMRDSDNSLPIKTPQYLHKYEKQFAL